MDRVLMRSLWLRSAARSLVIMGWLTSCGGDDTDKSAGGSTATQSSTSQKSRAAAGSSTTSSASSAGKSGSAAAKGPVACGSATCEVPQQAMGVVKACCLDETQNMCGYQSSFTMNKCVKPGAGDAQCPNLMIVGVQATGCCNERGKCGIDGSVIGMGCVELGAISGMAMSMGSGGASGSPVGDIPPPKDCNPVGAGADAGM